VKKIIDISGFGHSGKTSVTDLLREVEGLNVHHSSFEFNLLRLPDGLIDFKRNVVDNWSASKSDFAIKRFKKLCEALSENYSVQLNVDFLTESNNFIDSLIVHKLNIDWYDSLYNSNDQSLKTLAIKILKKASLLNFVSKLKSSYSSRKGNIKNTVYLVDQKTFIIKVNKYLNNILSGISTTDNTVVTNNAFEPFNPAENMIFFDNSFCVIVDRDPRDIYLSAVLTEGIFIPEFERNSKFYSLKYMLEIKKDMLGTNNIELFIWRQKQLRGNVIIKNDNDHVIRINYEDLVCNYEETISLLFKRLDIDPNKHLTKFQYFNPVNSVKNVGLWKRNTHPQEILKIENELSEYLYNQ
jgi:hypothetical protein